MHCQARGYVFNKCFECEDLFYPVEPAVINPVTFTQPHVVFDSDKSEESKVAPVDCDAGSLSSASLGMCMHWCYARGYVYNKCYECEDIFNPCNEESSSESSVDSAYVVDDISTQVPVVMEEETASVSAALTKLSLDPTKTNSTTSEYFPTYFDYFDAISDDITADPFSHFLDCMSPSPVVTL